MPDLLFTPLALGPTPLKNRVVMSPMTRSRAIGNIPGDLVATYYAQRAEAGLIVTEGTSPSPNGLGYARIPGLYNEPQADGWKKVTSAVHRRRGPHLRSADAHRPGDPPRETSPPARASLPRPW